MADDIFASGALTIAINNDGTVPPIADSFFAKARTSETVVWTLHNTGYIRCTGPIQRTDGAPIAFRITTAGAGDIVFFRKNGTNALTVGDIAATEVKFGMHAGTASDIRFYSRGDIIVILDRAGSGNRSFKVRNGAGATVLDLSETAAWKVYLTGVNTSQVAWDLHPTSVPGDARMVVGIAANGSSSRRGGIHVRARTSAAQPGVIGMLREDGSIRYLWADTSGRLRISQSLANVDAGVGVVVGTQS